MKKEQYDTEISYSILMANYNNSKYIEEAINSVINQTYTNWELIIVDDHSSDNSIEKILQFIKTNNKIKIIKNKENLGVGASKKIAAENANNEILGILDADDKLHERALEKIAEVYQKHAEYGLVYSTMWKCDKNLKNCIIDRTLGPIIPEKSSIFQPKISHFKTFRRKVYLKTSGYDPTLKKAVDKDIIYKLEEVCHLKFIDEPLYYYRWHGEGITQEKSHYNAELYHYFAKLKAYNRRMDKNITNFTKRQIKFEYYRIVSYKLLQFIINLCENLKILNIIKKSLNLIPFIPPKIFEKLR